MQFKLFKIFSVQQTMLKHDDNKRAHLFIYIYKKNKLSSINNKLKAVKRHLRISKIPTRMTHQIKNDTCNCLKLNVVVNMEYTISNHYSFGQTGIPCKLHLFSEHRCQRQSGLMIIRQKCLFLHCKFANLWLMVKNSRQDKSLCKKCC